MYEQMFFIGGFHRSGSMLLASILCQNENIHIEGKSALCQLMWDAKISIQQNKEILHSNKKFNLDKKLISEIPKIYYQNNNRKIVIDKNPWWTNINNMSLITEYIDQNFKMMVLYRSTEEIIKSFVRVYKKNNISLETPLISNFSEIFNNYNDFIDLMNSDLKENFLFIDYENLVKFPQTTIDKIYDFLQIEKIDHDFDNISKYYLLSNSFYDIDDLYEVGKTIKKREYEIELDEQSLLICNEMNQQIKKYKELGLC